MYDLDAIQSCSDSFGNTPMRLLLCAFLTFSILSLFAEDTAAEWELKSITLKSGGIMKGLVSEQGLKVFIDLGSSRLSFYSKTQLEALPDSEREQLRKSGAFGIYL